MKNLLAGLSTVFAAFLATAAAAGTPGYTVMSPITSINIREAVIDLYIPQANNPMGCNSVGWYRVVTTAQNYNAIASFIIAQYESRKPIRLFVAGCDTDGTSVGVAVGGDT